MKTMNVAQVNWLEDEGKALLRRAFNQQVTSLQKLVEVLEQVPRAGPFSTLRKDLTRSVNDLLMRGVWCIEPEHQEALLCGLWCHEWRLHQLLNVILEHSGDWYSLRAQLLGAATKALMVWGNVEISETMTPVWTGQELLEVTQNYLPQIYWRLQDYCWHEASCLSDLLQALQSLMDAKWYTPDGSAAANRLTTCIHRICDWIARLLMLRYGSSSDRHAQELLWCTSRQVRSRVLNRSYYVVLEKLWIFQEAAEREIEKREEKKRQKDLAAACRAQTDSCEVKGAAKPRFPGESGSGDLATKDPEPQWQHETEKERWADISDTS